MAIVYAFLNFADGTKLRKASDIFSANNLLKGEYLHVLSSG